MIRGTGLSCALGTQTDVCLARLHSAKVEPATWTISDLEAPLTVPVHRIPGSEALLDASRARVIIESVVMEAVEAAGLTRHECEMLPVFVGTSAFSLDLSVLASDLTDSATASREPMLAHLRITDIVQQLLKCRGDTFAFRTACTASANAVITAARMIRLGWFPRALVIGVELANVATMAGFSSLQLVSSAIRPFDLHREGIVLGEGIGAVVLSASDSGAAGVHIREGGTSVDAYRVTTGNPDGTSVAALQESVLRRAGIGPAQIMGIKAHGTGSPMNDASEAASIHCVFPEPPPVCALKPYLGHTLGACGVNEMILMAASLRAGLFPATPGFETFDPALRITPTVEPQAALDGYYMLNYFGFGGHNAVLIVEKRS